MRPIRSFFVAFAVSAAAGGAALADPIATCRTQSASDAERIDCLETAIRALKGEKEARAARAPAAAAPEPQGLGAEQVVTRERVRGERPEKEREAFTAGVVGISYTSTGRPVFTLDNDQVWRGLQPDPQHQRFTTERHKAVEIWDAKLAGYRLKVAGVKRVIQVERLK